MHCATISKLFLKMSICQCQIKFLRIFGVICKLLIDFCMRTCNLWIYPPRDSVMRREHTETHPVSLQGYWSHPWEEPSRPQEQFLYQTHQSGEENIYLRVLKHDWPIRKQYWSELGEESGTICRCSLNPISGDGVHRTTYHKNTSL